MRFLNLSPFLSRDSCEAHIARIHTYSDDASMERWRKIWSCDERDGFLWKIHHTTSPTFLLDIHFYVFIYVFSKNKRKLTS